MYSKFSLLSKYLSYYVTASNNKGHGIHSPFVFEFVTKVLSDKMQYPAYEMVENLRTRLLKDHSMLAVEDFGAGSATDKTDRRAIASIAKNAAKPSKFGQLLYRMVQYYRPQNILELGTSLGISTSYLSLAKPDSNLFTMEGAATIAERARQNFDTLNLQNILLIEGNFDQTLSSALLKMREVDFAFIDGNHRREPTERYFENLLPAINNNSILIFDDIHWSSEMEQGWQSIKDHPSVRCSIDLFFTGILFFRGEFKEKQHFSIRF
jgi:predicted O-methyltransferase YrrM